VLLVVGNTIRLDIQNRRREIEVAKLIGATDAFIRRPFLYIGAWYGLFGGIAAWLLVSMALWATGGPVQQLALLYQSPFRLVSADAGTVLVLLAGRKLGFKRPTGRTVAYFSGLGMGFTLRAALGALAPDAMVEVVELVPEVVRWNRGPLGDFSGRPLDDPRTRVHVGDVAKLLRGSRACFDVIALDVDNGPEGLTNRANDWLYSMPGIAAAQDALSPMGVLAYWSADPDPAFHDRLRCCGFMVDEISVHAHGKKGTRHTIWLASVDG